MAVSYLLNGYGQMLLHKNASAINGGKLASVSKNPRIVFEKGMDI